MAPAELPPDNANAGPSTNGAGGAPAKKSLFGWLSNAMSNLEAQAHAPAAEARAGSGPLPAAKPGSGPLGAAKPVSGPLGATVRSASLRLPGTGPMARPPVARAVHTGDLVAPEAAPATLVVAAPAAPAPDAPPPEPGKGPVEDPAVASRRRMAFIVAYMKDPASDAEFADKPLVYRVFSEEREYQQQLVNTLKSQLERPSAGSEPAERAELEQRLKTAQNRQSQLFLQLKKLTGVKGKTGGTGFLTAPDTLPEPKGLGGNSPDGR